MMHSKKQCLLYFYINKIKRNELFAGAKFHTASRKPNKETNEKRKKEYSLILSLVAFKLKRGYKTHQHIINFQKGLPSFSPRLKQIETHKLTSLSLSAFPVSLLHRHSYTVSEINQCTRVYMPVPKRWCSVRVLFS